MVNNLLAHTSPLALTCFPLFFSAFLNGRKKRTITNEGIFPILFISCVWQLEQHSHRNHSKIVPYFSHLPAIHFLPSQLSNHLPPQNPTSHTPRKTPIRFLTFRYFLTSFITKLNDLIFFSESYYGHPRITQTRLPSERLGCVYNNSVVGRLHVFTRHIHSRAIQSNFAGQSKTVRFCWTIFKKHFIWLNLLMKIWFFT